jgi:CMP-N,N'-diacetyllegionaminic acid synthase
MPKLTYCFDIDGTLCSLTNGDYGQATPFNSRIAHVRELFDDGNKIVLFTARGSTTGIDWEQVTKQQLAGWGVPYHELKFGKPFADIFIDDKALHSDAYLWGIGAIKK